MKDCQALLHSPNTPTDHPYTLSLYLLGQSVGEPEGVGGGGGKEVELVNLLFPKKFWGTLRANTDCA